MKADTTSGNESAARIRAQFCRSQRLDHRFLLARRCEASGDSPLSIVLYTERIVYNRQATVESAPPLERAIIRNILVWICGLQECRHRFVRTDILKSGQAERYEHQASIQERKEEERDGRLNTGGARLTFESVVDGNRLLLNRISDIELNDTSHREARVTSVREVQVIQSGNMR